MSKELVVAQDWSQQEINLIKATVAKGATDDEFKLFTYRCRQMGLDPLKPGQIHFVKYGTAAGTIVIGIDGFRSKAARTSKHTGTKRGIIRDSEGKCLGAWCEVYRSDWQHPAKEEVSLAEYNTGKAMWLKMPETMIKKVAEVAALRMAFPDELGGLYSDDEMAQAEPREASKVFIDSETEYEDIKGETVSVETIQDTIKEHDLGEYVIPIGKQKGTKFKDSNPYDLNGLLSWFKKQPKIEGQAIELVKNLETYLKTLEVKK